MSALRWADIDDATASDGVLVTVRRGKTNQEGKARDVRFVKGAVAGAVRTLRAAASPAPEDRVGPLSPKMASPLEAGPVCSPAGREADAVSVYRLAAAVSVGLVGESLDDADVERQRRERR